MRVGFLGPEGMFTSQAATAVAAGAQRVPLVQVADVVDAVRAGAVDLGVVPIENAIEGSVTATLDALAFGEPGVLIRAEVALPIAMHLLGAPGTTLEQVRVVRSHPVALAQCRDWLRANVPAAALVEASSTVEATRGLQPGDAALGPRAAAAGLAVLAEDVHDREGNATRFVVLGTALAPPSGADKTSVVVFFGEDRPGLLLRTLDEFALRSINLTKVESRPTKQALGEYCIFIDCAGHVVDARVGEALRSVHRHVAELRVLGSFGRADGVVEVPALADADPAYAEAVDWYERLVRGIG